MPVFQILIATDGTLVHILYPVPAPSADLGSTLVVNKNCFHLGKMCFKTCEK